MPALLYIASCDPVAYARHVTNRPTASPIDERVKRWNYLTATPAPFQVESMKIIESNVFAPQTIKLDRIVAFIGLHGTGKSLFLRMMEASFGYTTPVYSPPFLPDSSEIYQRSENLPIRGIVEVSLRTPSGNICRTVDLSQPPELRAQVWKEIFGENFMAWYADPTGAFTELHFMSDGYSFTHESTNSELERELSSSDLDALNNILGRRYDSVTVRSEHFNDQLVMPCLYARLGSRIFDNTMMSQGELWVHYINWFLEYEKDKGHLALIDEPESFLAAAGRRPFIDRIAQSALRSNRQVAIGTHSPEILSRFPLANIRMFIPSDSGIQIKVPRSLTDIQDFVGIQTPIRGLALVEDELAKQLLDAIFARYDSALTREVEIIVTDGASKVKIGSQILEKADRLTCFAILDANERTGQPEVDTSESVEESESSAITLRFLPGTECPERELIASTLKEIDWFAELIGVHTDQVFTAINTCRHLDHQYLLGRL